MLRIEKYVLLLFLFSHADKACAQNCSDSSFTNQAKKYVADNFKYFAYHAPNERTAYKYLLDFKKESLVVLSSVYKEEILFHAEGIVIKMEDIKKIKYTPLSLSPKMSIILKKGKTVFNSSEPDYTKHKRTYTFYFAKTVRQKARMDRVKNYLTYIIFCESRLLNEVN
jgi:hypothetical protein